MDNCRLRVFASPLGFLRGAGALGVVVLFCLAFAPPATALTQVNERQLVNQSQEEIEPALFTYIQAGVEYSVSVWMNFDPNIKGNSSLKYTAWTSNGLANTSTIPAVSGYTRYGDPVLVKHPTLNRVFLVALARNDIIPAGTTIPDQTDTAVVVWYSVNGGWSWSSPHIVVRKSRQPNSAIDKYELDKPVAATGPDGKLWVAYVLHDPPAGNGDKLQVQHGTLSGSPAAWNWSMEIGLPASNAPFAPQIMVDSDGDVYVLYTAYDLGSHIRLLWDDAATTAVSFTELPEVPNVGVLYRVGTIEVTPGVKIRAISVPIAKLDRTRRRIAVAWHEENAPNRSSTRLQFATYRIDTGGWKNVTLAAGGVHQVNVGMDYDSNGNYLVTWYRFNPNQSIYFNVGKYVTIDVNGNPTWIADEGITGRLGDVAILTPDSNGVRNIGEYHDVSYTNGTFKAVHLIIVQPWGDPWAFTVRP